MKSIRVFNVSPWYLPLLAKSPQLEYFPLESLRTAAFVPSAPNAPPTNPPTIVPGDVTTDGAIAISGNVVAPIALAVSKNFFWPS